MIEHIAIKNFKSLKYVSVPLHKLNLLMGLNGMGKSSLIQVLLLLMQSDKLGEGVLDLNGVLARIGQGKDALYQYAEEEKIGVELIFEDENKFHWEFSYQKEKEKLISDNRYGAGKMIYFRYITKLFQYICAERIGPREIYDANSVVVTDKKQLGLLGEFAAYYINVYGQEFEVAERLRHPKANSFNLLAQINAWMNEISPGVSLNTRYVPEVNKVILDYQFDIINDKTNSFRPNNVGFGISYVLPVVLALLTSEKEKIVIIENPESHIHPRGQAELGKLIALAAQNGAQLFIETHSDHILNGVRVAVRNNFIDKNNVNILFFDKFTSDKEQYSTVQKIKIDNKGELSDYPKNFLDEWTNQLLNLI
jgi:predicted ATPase